MKVTSKITENWWMIFKCFPPEPSRLWGLYISAIFVTLVLFLIAGLCAFYKHGRSFCKEPEISCNKPICIEQKSSWNKFLAEAKKDLKAAREKKELLKNLRWNPDIKNLDKSWNWVETEIKQLEIIEKSIKLKVASIKDTFPIILILVFCSLLFFLLMNRLVLLHANSIQNYFAVDGTSQNLICNWILPQTVIGILIAVPMALAEVCTSILNLEKTSFGWDSYCVTPAAWTLKCLAFISYGLAAATPFTMLWCLSRENYIPIPNLNAKDGKFGAERYVEFIQTWTMWLILAPSPVGILWVQSTKITGVVFSPAHFLYALGISLIIIIIIVRMIRNTIILRFSCSEVMVSDEYSEINRPQKDPTIDFLGTNWWKLPATIGVSLISLWAILEWLGIAKKIINIIR